MPFSIHRYLSSVRLVPVASQPWTIDLAKTSPSSKRRVPTENVLPQWSYRQRAHEEAHGHPRYSWESSSHRYDVIYPSYNISSPFCLDIEFAFFFTTARDQPSRFQTSSQYSPALRKEVKAWLLTKAFSLKSGYAHPALLTDTKEVSYSQPTYSKLSVILLYYMGSSGSGLRRYRAESAE